MRFDAPATTNPIDQLKIVGQPTDRIDGPLKTTGRAPYAYERYDVAPNAAYGYVVGSAIAKGRILSIDAAAAKALPGVLAVVTAENAGKLGKGAANAAPLLGGPEVAHYHQAIALVVAESFEQARAAAALVKVAYDRAEGAFDLASAKNSAVTPKSGRPESAAGDFGAAFAAAPVRLDETYATPDHSHAMMEPHASTASWNGDRLTVWTSNQLIDRGRTDLATTLGLPKGEGAARLALPRRRLRQQTVPARGRRAGGARGARGSAAGESDVPAAIDLQQYDPSTRDHPAHPHRRRAEREDHRDRPRELVGQSRRRQAGERDRHRRGSSMPARTE